MIPVIEQRKDAVAALCRRFGVLRLDLFGSGATGAFREADSDLDFVVVFADTRAPGYADRYPRLRRRFGGSVRPIGRFADRAFDPKPVPPPFHRSQPPDDLWNDATKKRLLDALLACRAIRGFIAGIDFAAYEQSLLIRSGVDVN